MAGQWTGMLEGALAWAKALPEQLSSEVAVDVAGRRVRLSHARVEALSRQVLKGVKALELRSWDSRPAVYDLRLSVKGWRLRVEATPERVELAQGRYTLWLSTPGRVELEESPGASSLMMVALRTGAGRATLKALAQKLLPPDLQWDGQVLRVEGRLPRDGALAARLFEASSLTMTAVHAPEGLWLSAEAWPGLLDLLQAALDARVGAA
ncbi:hypothetical protein D7Y13_38760 [Corallococcus praedator]|uniref:Uncharacterized protein n=1 Tax=Corallococcus praedator TaxID=2316724 RepID=A0ABX9Q7C4_9BACT|nr:MULTISPECIES: hypothetical protein [Corallococcus]RKG98998.1 hypothetical protein D7X74_39770 [Corallococcus sp. CA047B]RKH18387.1 hypothetical protein D7X75_39605 [Corallococcus sp. CA031C]RKH91419.1 hypothetical protein D7Y13_38760 [Corallococcus praedator]